MEAASKVNTNITASEIPSAMTNLTRAVAKVSCAARGKSTAIKLTLTVAPEVNAAPKDSPSE